MGVTACEPGAIDDIDDPDAIEADSPNQPLVGTACLATLNLTGEFTPGDMPEPIDMEGGCWPVGIWTINVEVTDPGACADIPIANQYVYQVDADPDNEYDFHITYAANPAADMALKITQEGGHCAGTLEHFMGGDTAVVRLKPFVYTEGSTTISGQGEYELYD